MTDAEPNVDALTAQTSGRNVLVTGGAGRLGLWIARRFIAAGDHLWLVDRDAEALNVAAKSLGEGTRSTVIDLTQAQEIDGLFAEIGRAWGGLDILINNAGIYPSTSLLDADGTAWDQILDVNLKAAHLVTRQAARQMIAGGRQGCVVNLISRSARTPRRNCGVYAVSKAGLEMLTRASAMELAPYGIRVNAVSPGLIPGGKDSDLEQTYLDAARANIPLGRFSDQQDAPAAIAFLCSKEASFITGTSLFVDGGSTAGDYRLPSQNHESPGNMSGETSTC